MKNFNIEEFKYPTSEFRGVPFWAWNTEITADKVISQIEAFKKMGFGGFIVHARKGLRTEYMGEHFMDMVRLSIEEAKKLDLRVWLYDEDGWPSGYAGGAVTAEKKYRQKTLLFTKETIATKERSEAIILGEPYFLASFDISLDGEGFLKEYKQTKNGEIKAYVITAPDNPRFNGQAYIDTMNKSAVKRFIELTYDRYHALFGDDFGKTVEAIFTDEPQVARVEPLSRSNLEDFEPVSIPWSDDFDKTYKNAYGEDIVSRLPEIIFELPADKANTVRYRFNAHVADRFRESFSSQIATACKKLGIKFTGHYLYEQSLETQVLSLRDVMRNYADQDIPGIDVLLGDYEFTTAIQCRSVARQSGKDQLMSELYGVTNYTSDFRDYLHQGNWQAALGVTERVPHLTWMSMLGEGKRDYPANFGYQAPWCEKFSLVEDYFARLNTVLKSGKPRARVGVIHPIESHWLLYGPKDKTEGIRILRDREFHESCEWLIFNQIDFDYVNEALLPTQFNSLGDIGEMRYDAIVVPNVLTLRKTTLDALKVMKKNGIRIIFAGNIPTLVDAVPSNEALEFAKNCEHTELSESAITKALSEYRCFEICGDDKNHISTERYDENARYVFISPAKKVENKDSVRISECSLKFKGNYIPCLLDPFTGSEKALNFEQIDGKTEVLCTLSEYDSLLLKLSECISVPLNQNVKACKGEEIQASALKLARGEDNMLLLDMAEYSLLGKDFSEDEILRIDTACRKLLSLPPIVGKISPQPWTVKDCEKKVISLRFVFYSEIEAEASLAFERAEKISLNGTPVSTNTEKYYVDRDIKRIDLPTLKKGKNVLEAEVSISKIFGLEPMYLLGDFGVLLDGVKKTVVPNANSNYGSAHELLMPFYGGNLVYESRFESSEGDLQIEIPEYRGALLSVHLDGAALGDIILPPYRLTVNNVCAGEHTLSIVCFGNRHNTFGSLHWNEFDPYCGPMHWHKKGDAFSYDYRLCKMGILSAPKIKIYK